MSHYCTSKMQWLHTDWFHTLTQSQLQALQSYGGNVVAIYAHIDQFFDAHIKNQTNRVCVTINCPNPWPPVLGPVWLASSRDETRAAMFLGNLYCRAAIRRPEVWLSAPYPIFKGRPNPNKWTPRHYFLGPQDWPRPNVRKSK